MINEQNRNNSSIYFYCQHNYYIIKDVYNFFCSAYFFHSTFQQINMDYCRFKQNYLYRIDTYSMYKKTTLRRSNIGKKTEIPGDRCTQP